jgi:preprotein translocase subunit YajC
MLECWAIFKLLLGATRVHYFQCICASCACSYLPIILMFVVLYFLMIRPQMKRQKEQKAMMEALAKGDEVVTAGGMLGKITKVADGYITLEIASGTEVVVQKGSITTLLPKGTIKTAL